MIIKDNFLTAEQLILVNQMIEKDIAEHNGRFERYDDEVDHHETDDCNLFYLNKEIKDFFFGLLVEKGYFTEELLTGHDQTLRYHEMKYPYVSTWHKDRFLDWEKEEIDFMGVTFFLNETWDFKDGGLFLFRKDDADRGEYVEPIGNRIIINNEDLYHAVTKIVTPDVKRRSLQAFMHVKYLNI